MKKNIDFKYYIELEKIRKSHIYDLLYDCTNSVKKIVRYNDNLKKRMV